MSKPLNAMTLVELADKCAAHSAWAVRASAKGSRIPPEQDEVLDAVLGW